MCEVPHSLPQLEEQLRGKPWPFQLLFSSLRKVVVALKPFLGVKSGNEIKPKEIRHTPWGKFYWLSHPACSSVVGNLLGKLVSTM